MSTDQADLDLDLEDLELFHEFARTQQPALRNQLVERHMGLAAHIAQRYSRAGQNDEDLRQVAMLGLVKSVDRFDPEFGVRFASFAGQTIEGELKRHFRDATWVMKVPRRAKELHLLVRNATRELEASTGSSPTVEDVALHLHIGRDEVLPGLSATAASAVGTIDHADDDDSTSDRQSFLASEDRPFEAADDEHLIEQLTEELSERERLILHLRFREEKSQREIADEVGVSQMHVSRLLQRSFEKMRELLTDDTV